ncbi:MAG TPA: tetratricopeptide repeat protein [Methylomirabilota bacterium]|nr:tetratricopeptide repeat protein [Methylomirabilota bacterium]
MIRRGLVPLVVAVLTAAAFVPTLSGSFLNWDDNVNFLDNPAYRGLDRAHVRWAFTSVSFGHYIPLTRLTWSLNWVLGGMNPWGYHLANVLLHAANAILFYVVARRLLAGAIADGAQAGRRAPDLCAAAAIAALVFGMHPLRVEPVAWITGRPDLLCAAFALLTAWIYLRAVETGGPARPGLVGIAALTLAAALLSKGAALPFVGALLLLDVYPLRRLRRLGARPLLLEKLPLLLVTLAGAGAIIYALRQGAVLTQVSEYSGLARLAAAAHSFLVAPFRMIWPAALSPLHELPARIDPLEPRFAGALLGVVLVTAALIRLRHRWPGGLAAWTFSVLMLAPTSVVMRQGADLAPDRYTYLSGMGFAVLVGGGALRVIQLVRRGALTGFVGRSAAIAGVIALVSLGVTSWSYGQVWRDSETLWRWAVEVDPDCSVCHGKLGESALGGPAGRTRVVEAEGLFRRAIALRPDLPDAYYNLGTTLALQGRYAEAEAPLRSYLERVPPSASGAERLGLVYLLQRHYEPAVPLLRTAFVLKPRAELRGYLVQALEGQAEALRARGRDGEADTLLAEVRAVSALPLEAVPASGSSPRP